ncbi:MAG: calcium/sodium antiporter [Planctomycetota bacterium]|jgi:cation:H+ antiporter
MEPVALAAVAVGLLLLVMGGDLLVERCVHLARCFDVPKAIVGAVIIGFGTSMPELFVSLTASLEGSPGIAVGNVVGSNIANVGLILGVGAVLATLYVQRSIMRGDLPIGVMAALLLLLWVGPRGEVSRVAGIVLLAAFALYLFAHIRETRRHQRASEDSDNPSWHPLLDSLGILGGMIAIVAGAYLLVEGATLVARDLGVSEAVIGLTLVAIGTSLPELAAIVAAVRKNEADLAVGNIAGSNLFNLLFVLGTTAMVKPIPVAERIADFDFLVLAVFAVLAFPLFSRKRRIGRIQGLIMVTAYFVYIGYVWR